MWLGLEVRIVSARMCAILGQGRDNQEKGLKARSETGRTEVYMLFSVGPKLQLPTRKESKVGKTKEVVLELNHGVRIP